MDRAPAAEPSARLARALLPYLIAVAAVSLGVLVRQMLARVLGTELPFITLFPVVFVVAYFLGVGPTILATALSIVAALGLFMEPGHQLRVAEPVAQLGAVLFGLTGAGIGWLGGARLQAQAAAASALQRASAEAARAEEETIRAEEEAARAEEETLRAEEEAQRSARESDRVERVLASIGDAFFVVDHRWMITYMNAAAGALLGSRPTDLVGRHFWEAFPGSADGPLGEMYRRAMGGGGLIREQAYHAPLGRWLQVTAYPSSDGLSIVAQDVSDRVRAQEASERLAAIVTNSVDAIIGKRLDGMIFSWNRGAEQIFGYTADEIVGRPIYTLVPPELHESEREILERVRRGEPVGFSETERVRKDGERIIIALSVSPIRDESGRVVGVSSIKRDITSERRTQTLLAAETARSHELTQVVDLTQALVRDLDGRISYWSTGAMRLYGWSAAEAVGQAAHELLHTEFPAPLVEINRSLLQHGQWEGQLVHVARDGRRLHVASQWVLRRDATGRPEGVFEVNTDETSRRQMEQRTQQSERLEVVGQLAGGVAHEANNQMTVVLGAADFLLRRPDLASVARQDVEQIRAAAERTAAITGQLLAFSRRQVLRPRVLDLDETVRGLDLVLRRALGEQSSLELRLGSTPGLVKADPGQLAQVLLNLVLNSRDAMPVGGRLSIETFCTELTEGYARQHPGVTIETGPYVVLVVSDTGHGMSRETAARIFEPFYTTKPIGQGTGLGLATVYGIVKQSEGYVWTYSELGKGTTFKIYLPLAAEARLQGQAPSPAPRASGEVVLLVEDEAAVRQMASRVLQEYGYSVLEASDGREALGLLERNDGRIRLMVTDVVMPEMDGRELARRVEALRPGLPVLYMSGYTDDEIVRRGLLEAGQPFLQKPFNPEALGGQIARMLQGRQA